jgi:hypothetical protein
VSVATTGQAEVGLPAAADLAIAHAARAAHAKSVSQASDGDRGRDHTASNAAAVTIAAIATRPAM